MEQVESGGRLVVSAGSTMEETVASIRSLSEMAVRISQASNEQSGGLGQINQAVSQGISLRSKTPTWSRKPLPLE